MHGPHQCAPTYSPNTACPGLVAYRGISFCFSCSRSSTFSSIAMKPVKDITTTKAARVTGWTIDSIRTTVIVLSVARRRITVL